MKRGIAIKWLITNNCSFKREGAKHSVFINNITGRKSTLPRHPDIDEELFDDICKQLGIPRYKKQS